MSHDDAELDLIRQAAKGDPIAQQRFLLQHRNTLFRYLERHVPDDLRRHIEPQDVYQDVCFDVFRRMSTFTATDSRMAVRWLLRIARNRVIDLVRMHQTVKRGGGRVTDLDSDDSVGDDSVVKLLQQLAIYERTPSRSAIHHELLAALERSIDRLPADYRQVVRARFIEGLPVDEVAKRMSRSNGAVLMLCSRGLKALRMELRSFSRYI